MGIEGTPIAVPWNLDVALIAVAYYAFGYLAKPVLSMQYRPRAVASISLLLSFVFILANMAGRLNYALDLKYVGYTHPFLDLVIPLCLVISVCVLSHWIARLRIASSIASLGSASLVIMYLHMYVNETLSVFFSYGMAIFVTAGLLIPTLLWWSLLTRSTLSRRLFLGAK